MCPPSGSKKRKPSEIYSEWQRLSEAIHRHFAEESGEPASKMTAAIALYKELLQHGEGQAEPLNHAERLQYVLANSCRYAAYRQLDSLFEEVYKQLAAMRSRKRFEERGHSE